LMETIMFFQIMFCQITFALASRHWE